MRQNKDHCKGLRKIFNRVSFDLMELSKHNQKQKAAADRRRNRIDVLRKANKSWTEIGIILGISRQRVKQLFDGRKK